MSKIDRLEELCEVHRSLEGPLLPVLRAIQAEFGCIDEKAERTIAQALNLARAEVHGVVSFYHDFLTKLDRRPEVQVCCAEACQARGVESLIDAAEATAGERVRLKKVYCLGLCSTGPNARIGDRLHSRLDGARLAKLIEGA